MASLLRDGAGSGRVARTLELRSELRKGTEAIVLVPKPRVLAAVPPLQPLGQERHRITEAAPPAGRYPPATYVAKAQPEPHRHASS